jgi:choline dehydrogenase-like flavoprotein
MVDLMLRAGAQFGFVAPFDDPPNSRHVMGTLRMGNDPLTSVCNANGRFHDVDNLYCADGAVFVTGSGYNPTLTLIALALRTAAAITAE